MAYKTYKVQNSKTREVEEKTFEEAGILVPEEGVPVEDALQIVNDWNRKSALQAHNHGNIMFTYFLD